MAEAPPVKREKREKRAEESLGTRLEEDVGAVEGVKSVEREERRKERRRRES